MREYKCRGVTFQDLSEVIEIEKECYHDCWDITDFRDIMRQKNVSGIVAHDAHDMFLIYGFAFYEVHKKSLAILNLATDEIRQGVGTALVDALKAKLKKSGKTDITMGARDTNLVAHLFLRSQGFIADTIIPGLYEDSDDNAYEFRYSIAKGSTVPSRNRISGYYEGE